MRRFVSGAAAAGLLATVLQFVGVDAASAQVACAASGADVSTALRSAKACGGPVEALDRRTPSSRTLVGPDGTATVEHHVSPRWVRRANGSWTDLDTTLRLEGDTLTAAATLLPVTFSPGGTGPLATLTDGTRKLSMTWSGKRLPAPVLSGATATYAEVLPDVDLRVTALPQGFSEVLVVKTAQAAKNPALARLAFDLDVAGATLGTAEDGGVRAVDAKGAAVFTSPRAVMWDTADAPVSEQAAARSATVPTAGRAAPRFKAMGESLTGSRLTVVPDAGFLTDPATRYPVYIDPTFTGGKASNAWAVVASRSDLANSKFWQTTFMNNSGTYGDAGAGLTCDSFSGNTCTSTTYKVRSLFRMETYGAAGATVISSNFEITQKWSWTCNTASDAKLWVIGGFNNNTTWNNQPAWDGAHTATAPGNHAVGSANGCIGAGTVSFDTTGMVQYAFSQGWGDISVGLQAVNEGSNLQWKRFDSTTAVLHIRYDHAPNAPTLSDLKVGPTGLTSCGLTAGAPTRVNTTNGLTLNAVLTDADAAAGDLVKAEWAVTGVAAQYVPAAETAGLTSGSNHQATIPAAAFTNGAAISWQVRGIDTDNAMAGGWSPACYLLVDNTAPSPPGVASTDLALRVGLGIPPAAAPTAVVRRTAAVTFTPAAADAGAIVGYRYGVAADADAVPTIWVPANGSSTSTTAAVVPLAAVSYNSVVVTAVKADGTAGATTSARFRVNPAIATPPARGDATGDGRADLTALSDVGGGKSVLWRWDSNPTGAGLKPPVAPQGNAGIFTNGSTLAVPGDFDNDGLADQAVFAQSGTNVTLSVQRSDGNQLLSSPPLQTLTGWSISKMKVVVGDFDGYGGKDDLAVLYDLGAVNWEYRILQNGSTGPGNLSFGAPVVWNAAPAGSSDWSRIKIVAGDFNGDGLADVAEFYDYGSAQTKLWMHYSTGFVLSGGQLEWDSGVGNFAWPNATFVSGDFVGDGRTDIATVYDYGNSTVGLILATQAANSTMSSWSFGWNSGTWAWNASAIQPVAGDYTGDGKADLGLVYRCCGPYQSQVWISASTGTTLPAPVEAVNGGIGPVGAGSLTLDTTVGPNQGKFQLMNVAGQTCAQVDADGKLRGQPCAAVNNQYFTVERRGAQYLSIHPVSSPTKCIDVLNAAQADGTLIQENACHGVATQPYMLAEYWTIEYLSGAPGTSVVRLTTPLSGKCLDVANGSSAPNTTIWEYTCNGGGAQQWLLRPVA
ncbi:RICIN domain-containing protein [Dactylosporangium sp. NPDC049742]|uniref:RICIN domain-containing protein n=1 Tax=Dactylosporangium sp. NPDC049742 TaxID=3154737 RepID=UPI00343DCEF4